MGFLGILYMLVSFTDFTIFIKKLKVYRTVGIIFDRKVSHYVV